MSSGMKRDLKSAQMMAEAFKDLFSGCWEAWDYAGSMRRQKPEVADIEHVVIPKIELVKEGLFSVETPVNLLLKRADELRDKQVYSCHVYGDTGFRWGQYYRGMDYRSCMHEIFCADKLNWGSVLAIRTGPWEFSRELVRGLLKQGRRNTGGNVWKCTRCPNQVDGRRCEKSCAKCQGTSLHPVEIIPAPTEKEYFELCGVKWVEPEARIGS